jgi:hypothetical protein
MVARAGTPDLEFVPLVTPYEKLTASSGCQWEVISNTFPKEQGRNRRKNHAKAQRRKVLEPNLCVFAALREIQERARRAAFVGDFASFNIPIPATSILPERPNVSGCRLSFGLVMRSAFL